MSHVQFNWVDTLVALFVLVCVLVVVWLVISRLAGYISKWFFGGDE